MTPGVHFFAAYPEWFEQEFSQPISNDGGCGATEKGSGALQPDRGMHMEV